MRRGISPRKEDIFKCMQALCAEFRDANIYTRVNLQSDGVNYAFSQSRSELNTSSKTASIPRLAEQLCEIAFYELASFAFVRSVTLAASFTPRCIAWLPYDRSGRDDFRGSSVPRKHQRRFTILGNTEYSQYRESTLSWARAISAFRERRNAYSPSAISRPIERVGLQVN